MDMNSQCNVVDSLICTSSPFSFFKKKKLIIKTQRGWNQINRFSEISTKKLPRKGWFSLNIERDLKSSTVWLRPLQNRLGRLLAPSTQCHVANSQTFRSSNKKIFQFRKLNQVYFYKEITFKSVKESPSRQVSQKEEREKMKINWKYAFPPSRINPDWW